MTWNHSPSPGAIEAQFKLACAWHAKGNLPLAESGFERVLQINPGHAKACSRLAELKLEMGYTDQALRLFGKALELDPDDAIVQSKAIFLKDLVKSLEQSGAASVESAPAVMPENPAGRINLNRQKRFNCHRSGWNFVLEALEPLHNSEGVMFDGFLENNFSWRHWKSGTRGPEIMRRYRNTRLRQLLATSEELEITPYREPWTGCIHNPQNMPEWLHYHQAPQTIFEKPIWQESLEHCRGLFAFSEYHAKWLREQTGKPVSCLTHPTEAPETQFSYEQFRSNPNKKIVQIGWWLRRQSAIIELPLQRNNAVNYEKIRLVPQFFDNAVSYTRSLIETEIAQLRLSIPDVFQQNTREVSHLSNPEYDELLSCNLAFVYLFDASANNAVIECIARATPLLVNPLPAVVEYLGDEYPLYFEDLSEAAEKALDLNLIERTHEYLKTSPTRARLSPDYFRQSVIDSQVYQGL
ncbi:tetratricopeptide repeat protein [Pseudomonadota bacterium]